MAIRFDKTTGKYLSRASGATGITGVAFAMSAWVYAVTKPATSGYYGIFHLPVGGYDQALEFYNQAGNLKLALYEGATETYSATLSTTTWYHVVMVRESATVIKLYVNGALDHTGGTNSIAFSNGQLNVGCWDSTTDNADIRICGIKIWNSSLTLAQVQAEYNILRPAETANLAIWSPVFPGSGERARDYSGNGRHFTENGTLTDEDPAPVSWGALPWTIPSSGANAYTLTAAQASFTLTGQAATLKAARLLTATQRGYTLTGNAAGLYRGYKVTAVQVSFTLTGNATGLRVARLLTATQRGYTLTGNATGLYRGFRLTAAQAGYTLTGNATTLKAARLLTATQCGYTLTGNAAGLLAARLLTATQRGYTLTGNATALLIARRLTAAQQTYTLTGYAVSLNYLPTGGYALVAAVGSFALTGNATALRVARIIAATQASYTLTGQSATLRAARLLALTKASYALTGNATGLYRGRLLTAGQGAYTLTGEAAILRAQRLITAAVVSYLLTGQATAMIYSNAPQPVYGSVSGRAVNRLRTHIASRLRGQAVDRTRS